MGVTGVHQDAGFSTGDLEEAYIKRALSQHAAETVVLASKEKLGAASAYKIGELALADTLVADSELPAELANALKAAQVVIVSA